jgi:GNAT superfamily N-acetyltransferase
MYLESIAKNGERFWVLDAGGVIGGFGGWYGDEIKGFYMHPDYTGRGWGQKLFEATENDYRRHSGFNYCSIMSTVTAKPFYERMGFQIVELVDHPFRGGVKAKAWKMIKHYG